MILNVEATSVGEPLFIYMSIEDALSEADSAIIMTNRNGTLR